MHCRSFLALFLHLFSCFSFVSFFISGTTAAPSPAALDDVTIEARHQDDQPSLKSRDEHYNLLPVRGLDAGTAVRKDGYIVRYKSTVTNLTSAHDSILRTFGNKSIRNRYNGMRSFRGFSGTFTQDQLQRLRQNPSIESIEADSMGEADVLHWDRGTVREVTSKRSTNAYGEVVERDSAHELVRRAVVQQTDAPWGLQRISQTAALGRTDVGSLDFTYTHDTAGDGQGVDIYVLDSGLNTAHSDFGGRATWPKTFGDYSTTEDVYGHGTHVAGTAGGARFGIAKRANLIGVRILSDAGTGFSSDCIAAIQWVMSQVQSTGRPSVMNISVKFGVSDALDAAVTDAVNAGIHVIVSAGNSAKDATSQSPARAPAVVTVGASDITDAMGYYSNMGPVVDIFAPGTSIISDWVTSADSTQTLTGTSMATPHVSGVTAYMISRVGNRSPAAMLALIQAQSLRGVLSGVPSNTTNLLLNNGFKVPGGGVNQVSTTLSTTATSSSSTSSFTPGTASSTADAITVTTVSAEPTSTSTESSTGQKTEDADGSSSTTSPCPTPTKKVSIKGKRCKNC
ncbi:subtilisin-like protein [Serendipita vermifera]|nr:subtilisin-like protein [Serendipita vermifera]